MRKISIQILLILLFLEGCGHSFSQKTEETGTDSTHNNRTITEKAPLENLGLNIQEGKIIFDINKTKDFFKKVEIEMHGKADEIERKIKHADINLTKGLGISFKDNKFQIDLNQTKEMLQQINILVKDILLDGNRSIH